MDFSIVVVVVCYGIQLQIFVDKIPAWWAGIGLIGMGAMAIFYPTFFNRIMLLIFLVNLMFLFLKITSEEQKS